MQNFLYIRSLELRTRAGHHWIVVHYSTVSVSINSQTFSSVFGFVDDTLATFPFLVVRGPTVGPYFPLSNSVKLHSRFTAKTKNRESSFALVFG